MRPELFTHLLYDHYNPPKFSKLGLIEKNEWTFPLSPSEEAIVTGWVNEFRRYQSVHRTNNVLILWGDDFSHKKAHITLKYARLLIDELSTKDKNNEFDIHFSSIDHYLKDVY